MTSDESRTLWCLIEGDAEPFQVTAPVNASIYRLKELILDKRKYGRLKGVDAVDLILCKVDIDFSDQTDDSLTRMNIKADNETKLGSRKAVSYYWSAQPSDNALHVFVKNPTAPVASRKRPHPSPNHEGQGGRAPPWPTSPSALDELPQYSSSPDTSGDSDKLIEHLTFSFRSHEHQQWTNFWTSLWAKGLDHLQTHFIEQHQRMIDNEQVTFQTLKVDPAFILSLKLKGLLIREDWKVLRNVAEPLLENPGNLLIVGQPGSGKTLSLYYILSLRVAQGLPTFLQYHDTQVWLFDENGVQPLDPNLNKMDIRGFSTSAKYCALVDSNQHVKMPAYVLQSGRSIFLTVASSPRKERWRWVKYRQVPTRFFYTKPFSLKEILIANDFQPIPAPEASLRSFFLLYSPSARDNYIASQSESALQAYRDKLNSAVAAMNWTEIAKAVSTTDATPMHDPETRFTVILVEPLDEKRLSRKANVITPTVMRLLWKAHKDQLLSQGKEFFFVLSMNPGSSPTAGRIFECQIHDKLENGIDAPLDPLTFRKNTRSNAVYDTWIASQVGRTQWKTDPMKYVPYSTTDRTLSLQNGHYYVPVDPNFATFDSFTFEATLPANYNGPIIDLRQEDSPPVSGSRQGLKVALFHAFQATMATEHDMKEKGLNYIITIAKENGFEAIAIRYIAVIPSEKQVVIKSPVAWRNKLAMFSLSLLNYDPKNV